MKTKKDMWMEMSIREISTQCHFAELSFNKLPAATGTDDIFMSIHSFLSHCAMVSKMLKSKFEPNDSESIGDILKISLSSIIHTRDFRNHLEHYDERLRDWIDKYPEDITIATYNSVPKTMIKGGNVVFVNNYDPLTKMYTFVDEDFDLKPLASEVTRIRELADNWVSSMIS